MKRPVNSWGAMWQKKWRCFRGITPPVVMSANVAGGDEVNKKYIEKYFPRVRHLY